jgi:hypothetical protein
MVLVVVACGGGQSVFEMEVGNCFDDVEFGEVQSLPIVDCSQPHDNEVYAIFDYDGAEFPGQEAINDVARELCLDRFEAYVGAPYATSVLEVFPITPTEDSWDEGDREIICNVYNSDLSKLTQSMRGAAR